MIRLGDWPVPAAAYPTARVAPDGLAREIMAHKHEAVFVDVDTQYDFMHPQGALYVPHAEQIVPNLKRLFAVATQQLIPVLSTADYHTPDDPEFCAYGFPAHCVAGTPGQQRLAATLLADRAIVDPEERIDDVQTLLERYRQVVFRKRTLDVWTCASAPGVLEKVQADDWYVFGVATDYCVKSAALGLAKAGKRTYVVADAVKALTPAGEKAAIDEMQAAGVALVTTDEVLQRVTT
jgi:nicotinamidase/pyrazinamidase